VNDLPEQWVSQPTQSSSEATHERPESLRAPIQRVSIANLAVRADGL
jgi:hypothetical protein